MVKQFKYLITLLLIFSVTVNECYASSLNTTTHSYYLVSEYKTENVFRKTTKEFNSLKSIALTKKHDFITAIDSQITTYNPFYSHSQLITTLKICEKDFQENRIRITLLTFLNTVFSTNNLH